MSSFMTRLISDAVAEQFTLRYPQRLPILMYHRILSAPDPLQPDGLVISDFVQQIKLLQQYFKVLPLDEALWRLRAEQLPARTLAITFDDSYRETRLLAAPVVHAAGLSATAFLTTEHLYLGDRSPLMFNDAIRECIRHCCATQLDTSSIGLAGSHSLVGTANKLSLISKLEHTIKYQSEEHRDESLRTLQKITQVNFSQKGLRLMMSPEEARDLEWLGWTIGGHTHSHPIMTQVETSQLEKDLQLNHRVLRALTSKPLRSFAYPNGRYAQDFTLEHAALVRSIGYDFAVTTNSAVASPQDNPFLVPRFATSELGYRFIWRILRMLKFNSHPASGLTVPTRPVSHKTSA